MSLKKKDIISPGSGLSSFVVTASKMIIVWIHVWSITLYKDILWITSASAGFGEDIKAEYQSQQ